MPHPCRAVVPRIRGHTPSVFGHLHRLNQRGLIAFFAPQNIVTAVVVEGLDGGGLGTQRVCGDDARERRRILTSRCQEAFGGVAFTIMFLCAVLLHHGCGPQRDHFTPVRMQKGGPEPVVLRRDRPVAVLRVKPRGTVPRLGGKIPRAIKGHHGMAIQKCPRVKGLATLELPQAILEGRP